MWRQIKFYHGSDVNSKIGIGNAFSRKTLITGLLFLQTNTFFTAINNTTQLWPPRLHTTLSHPKHHNTKSKIRTTLSNYIIQLQYDIRILQKHNFNSELTNYLILHCEIEHQNTLKNINLRKISITSTMPNTGEVQRKGFKNEIFVKKLKDFEQRTTQNAKHCCQNAAATSALLKAELVYSRYSPVKDFQALREERLVSKAYIF